MSNFVDEKQAPIIKAVFELAENRFWKSFSVKPTRLAATKNRFSGK